MKQQPITVREVLAEAARQIDAYEARLLLLHTLNKPFAWLIAHDTDSLTAGQRMTFQTLLTRRAAGEPVAYLTGHQGFWTLDLAVTPDTLIPRAETELLVHLALERLPHEAPARVLDLGTGSGAIALAIASERRGSQVIAVDASASALEMARGNAVRNGIANVEFFLGNWFAPLHGQCFDLIASNPPYIAQSDPHLQQGDLRFEPAMALSSGTDGLDAIRRIAAEAPAHLHAEGWLLLEHGWEQGAAVRAVLQEAGLINVSTWQDLERRDRVSLGRMP